MSHELLTPKQVQETYGLNIFTLSEWRAKRTGPAFIQPGGNGCKVLYRRADLDAWLDSWRVQTSKTG